MSKIEKFHDTYNELASVIDNISVINNRSLFQVYFDNLKFPAQFDHFKTLLHSMESPNMIKSRFSEYIIRIERKCKKRLEAYFDELMKACDYQNLINAQNGSGLPSLSGMGLCRGRPSSRKVEKMMERMI